MRKNTCELIRRELDELMLDETCSTAVLEHLRECGACREFQEKQTKLRQIVGSLGTVAAPADFDFRLRARLASESSSVGPGLSFVEWPFPRRGFAAAAMLLVFASGLFLVGVVVNRRMQSEEEANRRTAAQRNEAPPKPQETVTPNALEAPKKEDVAIVPNKRPQGNRTERSGLVAIRNKQPLATRELSSTGAEVIGGTEPVGTSTAFSVDASSIQYFKLSVDDGRGNAKTISVPTISFGSQRLMQNANQFAPKRVW